MDKNETLDAVTLQFSRYLTGWALSKAILEDYSSVISKLENVHPEEVKKRVMEKTKEYFNEAKESIKLPDEG